jgi:hypothetical protein
LREASGNVLQNAINIGHYVSILDGNHLKAQAVTIGIATGVILKAGVVARPVHLDDEFSFPTKEIAEIWSQRHLPAELMAIELSVSQALPQ